MPFFFRRAGFTLIELLVVIAIIAILSVVVILVLNPAQLLQQARDSNRISDMSTLNTALGVYQAQGGSSLGSANTIYLSIPDPSATSSLGDQCQGLGFNPAPNGYSYHCAATSTYRAVDSTGWIPLNFSSLPAGSPLGQLPQDPINTTTSREYYTYTTNGTQYEETSIPESAKYQTGGGNDIVSNDGGRLVSVYEKGSALGLEPMDYGDSSLVGFWSFNEGTGTIVYDYSGNNATGSWQGTLGSQWAVGKIGPYAGNFNGSNNYITDASVLTSATGITTCAWIKMSSFSSARQWIVNTVSGGHAGLFIESDETLRYMDDGGGANSSGFSVSTGTWHFVAAMVSGANITFYFDGQSSVTSDSNAKSLTGAQIGLRGDGTYYFTGLIDDVRIYNRALSATQIAAMYAGGK
jgi:prepilin-type N-terminal cleavage/methylation domain-containing protein